MGPLVERFWNEPAVAIGVLLALSIAALKVVNGGSITADDLVAILAPLGAGLGTRQFVSPRERAPEAAAQASRA
jgi:hypothetical protein